MVSHRALSERSAGKLSQEHPSTFREQLPGPHKPTRRSSIRHSATTPLSQRLSGRDSETKTHCICWSPTRGSPVSSLKSHAEQMPISLTTACTASLNRTLCDGLSSSIHGSKVQVSTPRGSSLSTRFRDNLLFKCRATHKLRTQKSLVQCRPISMVCSLLDIGTFRVLAGCQQ